MCCVTQQHNMPFRTDPGFEWQPVPGGTFIDGILICVLHLLCSAQTAPSTAQQQHTVKNASRQSCGHRSAGSLFRYPTLLASNLLC
jgi:hypothetical protein